MVNISDFTEKFLTELNKTFAESVWFVGLQGSYARGEATEGSDIDFVVILDELTADDVRKYNSMLDTLSHRELLCGFLSGKKELLSWEPADLFQFYYDTKPLVGTLDQLKPLIDGAAVDRAIKIGACNIYHGCVHNMLYEKSCEILKGLYKSASFVVQAIAFRESGRYISRQKDLAATVSADERVIIENFLRFKNGERMDFDKASETLLEWSGKLI